MVEGAGVGADVDVDVEAEAGMEADVGAGPGVDVDVVGVAGEEPGELAIADPWSVSSLEQPAWVTTHITTASRVRRVPRQLHLTMARAYENSS